jgi:cephalosporin hydroxylase
MTALDDFLAEHDRPYRRVVIPTFFGLAIVVEEERIRDRPELAAALDRLEGAEGRRELLDVGESARLRAMVMQHTNIQRSQHRLARAARRYLKLLKGALLDEHYLENEIRVTYLAMCAKNKQEPEPERVRDPVRSQQDSYNRLLRLRRAGSSEPWWGSNGFLPFTSIGRARLDHLEQCLDAVRTEPVPGDLVDCSVERGGAAVFLRGFLDAHEEPDRTVWVAGEFRASPAPEPEPAAVDETLSHFRADLNLIRDAFARFDLLDGRVRFLQGPFEASLPAAEIERVALLRLGHGIGRDARAALDRLYPRLSIGGFVVVDDYADAECAAAVDAYRAAHGLTEPLERVDASAVTWRKAVPVEADADPGGAAASLLFGLPLAPARHEDTIDLTVVVVFYNMRREAARTLHALSRAYQEGLEGVRYEVVAVENGSSPEEKLGREYVESFGSEFRYVDLGDAARPSPVHALNRGIQLGRGKAFALMIDGAHVLTPGVLRYGLLGLATYAPAIVATQQWYLGPGQQGESMGDGYDEAYEDRLFARINWPESGYRMFEIGNFVGGRDWLDGVWESNCMFASRAQLEQVGGFDERFSMPGGGFANLELYERLGSSAGTTVVSILGEGSFHQVHGGVTTNQPDAEVRRSRVFGYGEHYAELRGRRFRGPNKPIHYVGRIASPEARRTRARRLTSPMFGRGAAAPGPDGLPQSSAPVPDDLRATFVEAVWQSLAWEHGTWLGHPVTGVPTDLATYQDLIASIRPDWVIETGTGNGGRALFLASICELIGHGQVVSIGEGLPEDLPQHPRLTYVDGKPEAAETVARVRGIVGVDPNALVFLGRALAHLVVASFEAYAPLVPVGSYVVVTDTVVNGNPVWAGFSAGPFEATKTILARHGEFCVDSERERFALTFNPGGFLKRFR